LPDTRHATACSQNRNLSPAKTDATLPGKYRQLNE